MKQRELTAREKGLIYGLCCIIVLSILVVVLLLPGLERLQSVKNDRAEAEAQRTETETVIKNQAANEAALAELQSQAEEKTAAYYEPMDPEEADMLLSGMITRYGFTPSSLTMEPVTEAYITPYNPGGDESAAAATEAETDTTQDETAQDDTTLEEATPTEADIQPLQSYRITVTGESTSNQIGGLVGEICLNPSMHLITFDNQISISEESVYDDTGILISTNSVTTYLVTVTVEIFTYDSYVPQSTDGNSSARSDEDTAMDLTPGINTDTADNGTYNDATTPATPGTDATDDTTGDVTATPDTTTAIPQV